MNSVLVIDAGFEPLHRVSVQHAIGMLRRRVAVMHEMDLSKRVGRYPTPRVIRLVKTIIKAFKNARGLGPVCSKEGVRKRDKVCGYCGRTAEEAGERILTVDHILPRSRGGATSWLNLIASCLECNHKKAARTPEEAGMPLLFEPYVPNPREVHAFMATA